MEIAARRWVFGLVLLLPCPALATPSDLYMQAINADLAHAPERALVLYRQAAEAGSAEAQLNVAVMYDSGRGTPRDAGQAAAWYAQAALGGIARAAFDLGQLYEAGDGVPRNPGLARAWFQEASRRGIPAAAGRNPGGSAEPAIAAPSLSYPGASAQLTGAPRDLSLVWTAPPAPAAESFYVQVVDIEGGLQTPAFSTRTDLSAVRMPDAKAGHYAWRVFLLCPSAGRYTPSGWASFSIS